METKTLTSEMTLYQALKAVISQAPNKPALVFEGQTVTYRELGERVDRLARGLAGLGVRAGDKVAIILPNSLEFVYAFFAPSALGAAMVPISPIYRQREIQHILADCEAAVVITEARPMGNDMTAILNTVRPSLPCLRNIVMRGETRDGAISLDALPEAGLPLAPQSVSATEICAFIYTSGTTGVPKAVVQTHRSMLEAVLRGESEMRKALSPRTLLRLLMRYGFRYVRWSRAQTTVLSPAAMHALLGYSSLIYGLMYGFRVVIAERFHPGKVLKLIHDEHVNFLLAAPTMVRALLDSKEFSRDKVSSMLYLMMGAAPCPPELVRRARTEFGCPVVVTFGTTEIGGATFFTSPFTDEKLQTETVGQLLAGTEAKIVDDDRRPVPNGQTGELAVRLQSMMVGYHNAPELTRQTLDSEGWYYTGDLATIDAQGFVRIVGRKKDMIIRGGQNVYPAEIEAHLSGKPGVGEVSVVGVPDETVGERIWAFVVPLPGASITPAQVLGYCRGELAPFKVPDRVEIVTDLPMTPTGKVQKFVLRERALQQMQQNSQEK
jgi:fatty-acyl-CoA synthase